MKSLSTNSNRNKRQVWVAVCLIIFASGLLVERIRFYNAPLYGDICAYAVIGHETLRGRALYSDLWERKPPLLYATFAAAETAVGYGRQEIFVVSLVGSLATLLFLFSAGKSLAGTTAGLVTALLWALLNFDMGLTGNQPDPELFINAFIAGAIALLFRLKPHSWRSAVSTGLFLSAATLYKHNAVLLAAALLPVFLLPSNRSPFKKRLQHFTVASATVIVVWAGLFGYFYARGRLHAFVDVLFRQNVAYAGNSFGTNLSHALQFDRIVPDVMHWCAWPASVVIFVGILALFRRVDRSVARHWLFYALYAVGIWATVAVTGYVYAHYYQLWIPFWCLLGGCATSALLSHSVRISKSIRYAVVTIVFVGLELIEFSQFQFSPEQWVKRQFPYFNLPEQNAAGVYLGQLLKPTESFYELGEDNALYFFSKHSPPSGLLFIDPLLYGTDTAGHWNRLLNDLDRKKPDMIILSDAWLKFFPANAPIFSWLPPKYIPASDPNLPSSMHLFVLRGSALAMDDRLVKRPASP